MTITRRMDRQGLVTTEIKESTTLADLLDSVLEFGELIAYSNELWEIVLLSPDLMIEKEHRTTLEVAHSAKEMVQFKTRGAIAIVASGTRQLQWSHKVAELIRGDAVPVTVFDDESQARKWLMIHMEQSQFDATTVRSVKPKDDTRMRRAQKQKRIHSS